MSDEITGPSPEGELLAHELLADASFFLQGERTGAWMARHPDGSIQILISEALEDGREIVRTRQRELDGALSGWTTVEAKKDPADVVIERVFDLWRASGYGEPEPIAVGSASNG